MTRRLTTTTLLSTILVLGACAGSVFDARDGGRGSVPPPGRSLVEDVGGAALGRLHRRQAAAPATG